MEPNIVARLALGRFLRVAHLRKVLLAAHSACSLVFLFVEGPPLVFPHERGTAAASSSVAGPYPGILG